MRWSAAPFVNLAGPLTIYAAVTVPSGMADSTPRLLWIPNAMINTLDLWAGWKVPSLSMAVGQGLRRNIDLDGIVDWSTTAGATRVIALSLPAIGLGGEARWYAGRGRWKRVVESSVMTEAEVFTDVVAVCGPSHNGVMLHELRIIAATHREATVAATHDVLVQRWGATVS